MLDTILLALCLAAALAILVVVLFLLRTNRSGKSGALEAGLREEFRTSRQESAYRARELREEIGNAQAKANAGLAQNLNTWAEGQRQDLGALRTTTEEKLEAVRKTTEEQLKALAASARDDQQKARETLDRKLIQIQEGNEKKLEQMRVTVDEKLQSTIEKRLGASFKLVSTQLEAVQRGLGEMQNLATGVGDLKRVLTNVKERGTWGEYQLEAILEQILTPDQFDRNVATKPGGGPVEFAIKLPGKTEDSSRPVWLPIDAKFPKEDYERLIEATRQANPELVAAATRSLEIAVKRSAKEIHDKYIEPPATTDFGIMFLATEGLYAEILRQPGLHDEIQRKYRIIVAGPTTLAAILNSLRVGFQTLAIEKRAHEVWNVLGAVKTEFGKFGDVLGRLKRQIDAASNTIDQSQVRTRAMERRLRSVEALPAEAAEASLALPGNVEGDEDSELDREVAEAIDATDEEDGAVRERTTI